VGLGRVTIVGGGFGGLAAGVALAARGVPVTVLEARPRLGGRAYSFRDAASGAVVDNGQHMLMGCYEDTLAFLERIGASGRLRRQHAVHVEMVDPSRGTGVIGGGRLPAPAHMLPAILGYRLLGRCERLAALAGAVRILAMRRGGDPRLAEFTVAQMLAHTGQSANACRSFWHPLAVATLNETPACAAAAPFAEVLARAFFGSRADAQFILPTVGLSDLYTTDAARYIERRGGRVECHAVATDVLTRDDRVSAVRLRDGRTVPTDVCIGAVPPRLLPALLPATLRESAPFAALDGLGASPIVSVHLWWDRPVLRVPFVGLIDTTTQWLFNRSLLTDGDVSDGPQQVSAVISAGRDVADWEPARIERTVADDVRRVLPAARDARLERAVVVKEKHATIATTPAAERVRPGTVTAIDNLFLAGDWTATRLPPTIESAVVSGHRAADATIRRLEA
jgi:squalene-associated FAD-dependent desaturase